MSRNAIVHPRADKIHLLRPFYTYNNAVLSLFANNHMPNPDYQSACSYILTLIQQHHNRRHPVKTIHQTNNNDQPKLLDTNYAQQ